MAKAPSPRGLQSITDNVPAGMRVGGIARDFALIFRDELAARFIQSQGGTCSDPEIAKGSSHLVCVK